MAFRSARRCSRSSTRCRWSWAFRPSSQEIDPLGCDAELAGRGADFAPGLVIHGNALALALRPRFAFGLAGDAYAVVPGRGPRGAQPGEETLRVLLERLFGAQARGVDHDRDHAVQHAPLGLVVVVDNKTQRRVLNGMISIVIDAARLGTEQAFKKDAKSFLAWLRASRPAPGHDRVRIAGEPARETRAKREREGIPVDDETWREIRAASGKLGIASERIDLLARGTERPAPPTAR